MNITIDITLVSELLGWCLVFNVAFLLFTTLTIMISKQFITAIHSKLIGINVEELPRLYFSYLATYKILIIVFNLVPYMAIQMMFYW